MKHLFTLLLIVAVSTASLACGNEYGHTLDGRKIYTRNFYLSERMMLFDKAAIQSRINRLRLFIKNAPQDYKHWSDLSVNFLKIGKVDSALNILAPLAKKHPQEYNIAANLGTAYELKGKLDSALKYISRGYELNPKSHMGSEWVHVKILEAKIKDKKQPGWIKRKPILTQEELIKRLDTERRYEAGSVNGDVFYQVRTRAPFTPAPNKVLKNILVSLGEFNKNHGTYENALMCYVYAMKFEKEDVYALRKIKNKIRQLNKKRAEHPNSREIDDAFIGMMKRSEINPELLLLGLNEFANQLDSTHLHEINHLDSLNLLKTQLDSIANIGVDETKPEVEDSFLSKNKPYIYMIIGLFIGVVGALLFRKKK